MRLAHRRRAHSGHHRDNTVSGIAQLNVSLSALAAQLTAGQQTQAALLIGSTVLAPGNSAAVADGKSASFGVQLERDVSDLQILVKNAAGQVVDTRLAQVQRQFTQGGITNTGRELDIAINGNGFSRCKATACCRIRATECSKRATVILVPLRLPMGNMPPEATTSISAVPGPVRRRRSRGAHCLQA